MNNADRTIAAAHLAANLAASLAANLAERCDLRALR